MSRNFLSCLQNRGLRFVLLWRARYLRANNPPVLQTSQFFSNADPATYSSFLTRFFLLNRKSCIGNKTTDSLIDGALMLLTKGVGLVVSIDDVNFLTFPVSKIINASLKEQCLPHIWKLADVTPLPKRKPVRDLKKDLRPISLTACLSKVAEECVVSDYVKSAVLRVLDPNQYGAVPNSSTTQALIQMIHRWAQGTDGNGATVRATLYDYRKAFDLIDHDILVRKLTVLDIPKQIINWIIDFFSGRSQRIKLAKGCFSEWESVPSGVPQGTKLAPWLFLVLINDLEASSGMNAEMWKYVDDTTTSEVVIKGKASISQRIADHIMEWSSENRVQLNNDKCKELRITFSKQKQAFPPIIINGKGVETVKSAKLLGVTISDDLSWNEHVREVVKKASKRLYFLV